MSRFKNQTTMLKKFEKLMKPIIIKRDGGRCSIEGYRHCCSGGLVVDHRPSKRGNHSTFLDPRNLTTVCGAANFLAEIDPFISVEIIEVMKYREGSHIYEELEILSKQPKKWSEEECILWVQKCAEFFKFNKSGRPL